jgi:HEPN domain-containing protein
VEKALKALLIRYETEFGKTHDLGKLLRLAEPATPGIVETLAESRVLTPYAVKARYPGEGPPIEREEARRQVAIAGKALTAVTEMLKPYLDAGRPGGTR